MLEAEERHLEPFNFMTKQLEDVPQKVGQMRRCRISSKIARANTMNSTETVKAKQKRSAERKPTRRVTRKTLHWKLSYAAKQAQYVEDVEVKYANKRGKTQTEHKNWRHQRGNTKKEGSWHQLTWWEETEYCNCCACSNIGSGMQTKPPELVSLSLATPLGSTPFALVLAGIFRSV